MTSYIFLDTLRFFAHHGVGEQETVVGNEFTVSLRLPGDIPRNGRGSRHRELCRCTYSCEGRDGHSFQTIGTCMRANYKPIVPRLPTDRRNNPQAGKAQSTDGRGYRGCRSGNMPTPRRMTDCRITPFTIDTQTLPTAKTLHAFCSGAANGLQ